MPFTVVLRVLPGLLEASLGTGAAVTEADAEESGAQAAGRGSAASSGGQIARMLQKRGGLMMLCVMLLKVKKIQLEDDVKVLRGLKVREFESEPACHVVIFGFRNKKSDFLLSRPRRPISQSVFRS